MTIAIDSNAFIYALNAHREFGPGALKLLKLVENGENSGVASELVYLEVLSKKTLNTSDVIKAKQLLLLSGVKMQPIDMKVLLQAASLRRETNVSMPDAIHLASALTAGATKFITNDQKLLKQKIKGLEIIPLELA